MRPVNTINFHETNIGAWEERGKPCDPIDARMLEVLKSVMSRLRDHRGFQVRQDASVHKLIRRAHYVGRKGDLEFHAETGGRTFSITFFQNVNIENPHGGRYDFRKFERMPKLMQLACVVEMSHVLRKLVELGYVLEGRRQAITSTDLLSVLRHAQGRADEGNPLAKFNRTWGDGFGTEPRFERDESGWPSAKAMDLKGWVAKDRDGLPVEVGSLMYCRDAKGHLFRGIARPVPNGQWKVLGPGGTSAHAWASRDLFRDATGNARRFVHGQAARLRKELDKALRADNYRRVAALADVLRRVTQ